MNYIDIVMDEFIKETFLKIDKENNSYISHGMQHTLNVVENIEKIAKILDIDETTLNYLKIAGYLHDIGRVYGDDDHYLKSRDFVYKYLNGKIEEVWFNKILSAIQRHHEKENVANLPLFEHIVLFADKMDFSCKRLVDNSDEYFESKVLGIDFAINKNRNVFIIILKVSDPLVSEEFSQWHMYNKVLKRIVQFAEKLNMDYEIKFVS